MIRIILADDHTIFLQGLAYLLEAEEDIEIIDQVTNGKDAWTRIQELHPDVAVLDISMGRLNGIEVCRLIEADPKEKCRSLLLTMHVSPLLAIEGLHAGASGYILKDNTFEELADAIRDIHAGKNFISAPIDEKMQELKKFGGTFTLSERERQVLASIAQGHTNKETARQLDISPKTVETYRNRIMDKLDVRSIAELSRYASKLGLVE
jgi:DNA-binding NarL/FixJ family response regulator